MTFKDGTTDLGTGTLSGGKATYMTNTLSVGTHGISASHLGDANNAPSTTSTPLSQVVNPSTTTTTTLKSHPNPSKFGASVTFTATITGNKPTGTVMFNEGKTVLGTATINKGKADFTTRSLSNGDHSISAFYGGDAKNSGSSASITQTVRRK